jgi:hypothetical protein
MERKPINPWSWSTKLGFDQAELVEGHRRQLFCSGQDAVDADGDPQHPGDMAAQLELALDNLESVLAGADMSLADVVRLNVHTTFPPVSEIPGPLPPACSASRGWQHRRSSSCWRQRRLTDSPGPSPRQLADRPRQPGEPRLRSHAARKETRCHD